MVAMSRLALLADSLDGGGEVVAVLDAGRGEYFCGVYADGARVSEQLARMEEVRSLMQGRRGVVCEARVAESLGAGVNLVAELVPEPGPRQMLAAALRRIEDQDWSDVASVDANYLRRTDAEILIHGGKAQGRQVQDR